MESILPGVQPSADVEDLTSKPSPKASKSDHQMRRVLCRYGAGCTHLADSGHREKFWHPVLPQFTEDKLSTHHVCNECGYTTTSLLDLTHHLRRKTAWSNQSLVGCRINCLVDSKEWHEGLVTQFHKSGKHYVEFRAANERRWLVMKKLSFYIVERPRGNAADSSEYKDGGGDRDNPALENHWDFVEDIVPEFALAQSVLFKIYGNSLQETGHLTKGHVSITPSDKENAQQLKISLLYGELLPRGANKAFGAKRLEVHRATSLFDLGMGTGKIVIQAFLQFKHLRKVMGVELSQGRYMLAEEAALRMVRLLGSDNCHVELSSGRSITITEMALDDHGQRIERSLHMHCGNMFDEGNLFAVDVVMMETDIPADLHLSLQALLGSMRDGARVLTYLDLRKVWRGTPPPFKQVDVNRNVADRYPTSWSVQRGHHFFVWTKAGNESNWAGVGFGQGDAGSLSPQSSASPPSNVGLIVDVPGSAFCLPLSFFGLRFGDRKRGTKQAVSVAPANSAPLMPDPGVHAQAEKPELPALPLGALASPGNAQVSASAPSADGPTPKLRAQRKARSSSIIDPRSSGGTQSPRCGSSRRESPRRSSRSHSPRASTTIVMEAGLTSSQCIAMDGESVSDSPRGPEEFPSDIRTRLRSSLPTQYKQTEEDASTALEGVPERRKKSKSRSRSTSPRSPRTRSKDTSSTAETAEGSASATEAPTEALDLDREEELVPASGPPAPRAPIVHSLSQPVLCETQLAPLGSSKQSAPSLEMPSAVPCADGGEEAVPTVPAPVPSRAPVAKRPAHSSCVVC